MGSAASPEIAAFPGGYEAWRELKLAARPKRAEDLIVEVRDVRDLSAAEKAAIADRVRRANMAVYASRCGDDPDREIPRALGRQFALRRLDPNWLSDDDGISSICVREGAGRGEFIPYTNRPLGWHTDGYYNPPERRIRAFVLHCVRPAAAGGETILLDHDLVYALLRDANPQWVSALEQPDAMTIPARDEGTDAVRAAQTGPVFCFDAGALHMRYTARSVNIQWATGAAAAARFLVQWLTQEASFALRLNLGAGMGVICNNVLHARETFRDDPAAPRLLYRARFHDRIRAD